MYEFEMDLIITKWLLHCGKYLDSTPTFLNNLIESIEDLIVPNFVK